MVNRLVRLQIIGAQEYRSTLVNHLLLVHSNLQQFGEANGTSLFTFVEV